MELFLESAIGISKLQNELVVLTPVTHMGSLFRIKACMAICKDLQKTTYGNHYVHLAGPDWSVMLVGKYLGRKLRKAQDPINRIKKRALALFDKSCDYAAYPKLHVHCDNVAHITATILAHIKRERGDMSFHVHVQSGGGVSHIYGANPRTRRKHGIRIRAY